MNADPAASLNTFGHAGGRISGLAFYEYDLGDSWLHRMELMSRRPLDEDSPPARLIDGARRGPLEDSGGLPGYEEIMAGLSVLNLVVSRDVGTDRLDETNLPDSFSFILSVP
ncbi:plasmid pRiA4b ORF-3 family protein [Pseudarthrobacter cellobiosi]|uniref:plasmid pRiA4b ORF-3 family protein n=1 Tax=Pseudarthrobacter cellobiosi TaxID=2953654 RepID=UPI00208E2E47|nr:plasmid pRiA4b ORF-3 family protein [Pseudarthrobacter sp. HLT1-5]MCO4255959.1 plasmid pRiA4b ORF-3 family protein [Pseudarthrobacter sp. HLT1-5]